MATIEFQSVSKRYAGHAAANAAPAVDTVSLQARDGEFLVLVGPSGCGKSTLLRMAAGLESVTSGRILIGGEDVTDKPPRLRDLAMVFQDYALYPHKSVYENLAFGLRMRKTPEAELKRRVMHAAELLQIGPMLQRLPAQLSGGQRQRVAIGRAIVREPKVFLFDEPLSNLDAQLRNEMRVEIKRLQRALGATVVYVTHDQVEAMTMADRIAVMRGGHVMQHDTPAVIYRDPKALFVGQFMGSPPMSTFELRRDAAGGVWLWPDGTAAHAGLLQRLGSLSLGGTGPVADRIVVGARPEHIQLAHDDELHAAGDSSTAPNTMTVAGRLIVEEPLGAETLVTAEVHGARLVARVPSAAHTPLTDSTNPSQAPTLRLRVDLAALKFFDAATGASLSHPKETP
jgi:ABC-type sugar transport system ATPase subunit